jgi:hypothetical protein
MAAAAALAGRFTDIRTLTRRAAGARDGAARRETPVTI